MEKEGSIHVYLLSTLTPVEGDNSRGAETGAAAKDAQMAFFGWKFITVALCAR